MSLSYDISGNFKYPLEAGADLSSISFAASGTVESKAAHKLVLTGSGTQSVSLGSVSKIKALYLSVGTGTGAAPISVKLNGATTAFPIAPGGGLVLWSPSPVSGITSVSFDYTSDIEVDIVALG